MKVISWCLLVLMTATSGWFKKKQQPQNCTRNIMMCSAQSCRNAHPARCECAHTSRCVAAEEARLITGAINKAVTSLALLGHLMGRRWLNVFHLCFDCKAVYLPSLWAWVCLWSCHHLTSVCVCVAGPLTYQPRHMPLHVKTDSCREALCPIERRHRAV